MIKSTSIVVGFFGLSLSLVSMACTAGADAASDPTTSSTANRLTLDVRCSATAACPSGFECDSELEHGVSTTYCKSQETLAPGSTAACPAGFETEAEHGANFCKPHGGAAGGGGGADDTAAAAGSDDDAGATGTGVTGNACKTSADCAAGLECEIQVELGVTTSTCKAHGGGKKP